MIRLNFIYRYKWLVLFLILFLFSILLLSFYRKRSRILKQKMKVETFMKNKVKKVVLDNGLTVLIFKNTQTPKVLLQIAYDVGSWVEQQGERGMAHLIEHMIFKGTNKLSEGDIDSIARKYGASFNAFTGKDMTSYYFEVDKSNWEPFADILADCMQNARFDSQHLASEFRAVIQELRMYLDDSWQSMFLEAAKLVFPSNYPYHFPIIGFKEDLVDMQAENLRRFYKKYYRPERATLFIVGDIDIDNAIDVAVENFSDIPNNGSEAVDLQNKESMFSFVPNTMTHSTNIYRDVKTEQQGFYWLIPGLKSGTEEAISVLEFVLGHGEGSRLYKRLVEEEKIAASVGCFGHQLMEAGIFFIFVEPLKDKSEECRKIINEELNKIISQGLLENELEKVIKTKEREFLQKMQALSSFTYEWIKSFIATRDEKDVFNKVNKIENVDNSQIKKISKQFLDPFFMNEIKVLPLPEDKKEVWLHLKEKSEEMDKLILDKHPRTAPLEKPKFVNTLPEPKKLDFEFPKPSKNFTLENGLNVLLYNNDFWPIFSVNCRFKQADVFHDSKEGILLDFMMNFLVEGSQKFTKNEIVDFFDTQGASYNFDVSGGSISGLTKNYKEVLKRFFQVLTEPAFPEQNFDKLKNIFIDHFKRRQDSQIDVGVKHLKNLIYKDHPFEWNFEQAINLLNQCDVKKLEDLYKKYVSPKNMVLSISGKFDLLELEKNIKNIFKDWNGPESWVEIPEKGDFQPNIKIDQFMLRDQVLLLFGRPSILNIYDKDLVPVKMLDFIAFSSIGSRLYDLREKSGLFYTAFGMFGANASRFNGFDYVGTILNLENVEKTEKLIFDVIDNFGKKGAYEYELKASKQSYLKGIIDITGSNESLSGLFARLKSLELGFDYYDKVLDTVQEISLTEINKICSKYFDSKNMNRVRVGRIGEKK